MTIDTNSIERLVFQISEDDSVGNNLSFGPSYDEGCLDIEIDNLWSGDTETGFGRTASMRINKQDAKELAEFLLKWVNQATEG